eukprot:6182831-Pleurochrysis_carterae.AAC.5
MSGLLGRLHCGNNQLRTAGVAPEAKELSNGAPHRQIGCDENHVRGGCAVDTPCTPAHKPQQALYSDV